jgi:Arylsulfotransferase (ASST)
MMPFASVAGRRLSGRFRRGGRTAFLVAVLVTIALSGCALGRTGEATETTHDSATLNGTVFSTTTEDATYWFEYGPSAPLESKTETRTVSLTPYAGDGTGHPVSATVGGLNPATAYEFRLCARGSEPRVPPVCGQRKSFTTSPAPPTTLSITSEPALSPAFDPAISDYVTRCTSDPVMTEVAAPAGTEVAVDGEAPQGGRFSQAVQLGPGQSFGFTTATGGVTSSYHVRCLPSNFPAFTYSRSGEPSQDWMLLAPSLGVLNPGYVAFFGEHGVPVWWYRATFVPLDAKLLSDGTVAFAAFGGPYGIDPAGAYQIRQLDGTLVRTLSTVGTPTDFHDLQKLANGNYLTVSYRPRDHADLSAHGGPSDATVLDAEIQELTPEGSLVWSWNSQGHIGLDETEEWWPNVISGPRTLPDGRQAYDHVHINAIEPDGNSVLISLRHTDAVYSISRLDGHVEWKLGGTTTPESLTVLGDPHAANPLGGQHDVRRLADGTVSVHDNGTRLGRPPRAVRYAIDTDERTATLAESLSDPEFPASGCCGSARKLDSGGWLLSWGGSPSVTQYAADGSRVSNLSFSGVFSYRAVPVPNGSVSAATLRQAMDTMFPR